MGNACVYLHETIDIVGTGSEPYKAHTGKLGTNRTDGGAPLVGTWQQSGSTGSWPTVVNLWEMRGWDHWAEILERQYTRASGQEPTLKRWWTEATKFRSGGFDRILEPAPYSPTRADLIRRGVRGRAVLQEIATVKPGRAERYLDAVAARWRPAAAARGLTLVGAFRTAMRDTEAVLLWSLPDFATYTRHVATVARDRAVRRWTEYARTWRIDHRETLLVPSIWCVTHPDWRETPAGARARRGAARRGA
jgi:NIPSNAP protein